MTNGKLTTTFSSQHFVDWKGKTQPFLGFRKSPLEWTAVGMNVVGKLEWK